MNEKLSDIFNGEIPSGIGGNVQRTITHDTLGEFGLGQGNIGPTEEMINSPVFDKEIKRITSGEFNEPVSDTVPVICVDGRTVEDGTRLVAPSGAGATLGIAYSRKLAGLDILGDITELELVKDTVRLLTAKGHRTSVHNGPHSSCDCGACAKAPEIFSYIENNLDPLIEVAKSLGVTISHGPEIKANAETIAQSEFFDPKRESVLKTAEESGAYLEKLDGDHEELSIAINTIPNTTISRERVRDELGMDLFVVDYWAIGKAAEDVSKTGYPEEISAISDALTLFNLATASVLANNRIPIVPVS